MLCAGSKLPVPPSRVRGGGRLAGITIGLCLLIAMEARSVPVEGLYEAEVPVAGLAESQLEEAFARALGDVLVKVTGRRTLVAEPAARQALASAGQLVRQYQPVAGGQVRVRFDPAALRERLDALGLPVWGDDRPVTRVLVPADLLPQDFPDPAATVLPPASEREILLATAARRGLPVILGNAAAGNDGSPGAGQPVLVAQRAGTSGAGVYRWTLLQGADRAEWQGDVAEGLHGLADRLGARYASVVTGGPELRLRIDEVHSFDDYGRVQNYLRNLDVIRSATLEQVAGGTLIFRLTVRGDAARLREALALQAVLEPAAGAGAGPDGDPAELRYRVAGAL